MAAEEIAAARKIVHVDMTAFYASVEQRDNPALRRKPVVVAWEGKRSVVCAASYEARRFGVRSAMPAVTAERMCPDAIFVPPDFTRYKAVSLAVREIFQRHTDLIEPLSLDEAYLDVTANKMQLPTATRVAKMIREQIREELNLTASAGVAEQVSGEDRIRLEEAEWSVRHSTARGTKFSAATAGRSHPWSWTGNRGPHERGGSHYSRSPLCNGDFRLGAPLRQIRPSPVRTRARHRP